MRLLVLLLLFIVACKPAPMDNSAKSESLDYSSMNLSVTKMTLVGKAQKDALKWTYYQDFITGLENYDHSIKVSNQLIDYIDKMLETPEEPFTDQAIISRIKIVKTRLHIYKSYLGYRIKTEEASKRKYNDIILAIDELTDQMNWQVNEFNPDNKKLLEDLKADLDPEEVE